MKISDILMYLIYQKGNTMTNYELLHYIKRLEQYDVIAVNEDGVSYSLTDKGMDRLVKLGVIKLNEGVFDDNN